MISPSTSTLPLAGTTVSPGSFLRGCLAVQLALVALAVLGVIAGLDELTMLAGVAVLANSLVLLSALRRVL